MTRSSGGATCRQTGPGPPSCSRVSRGSRGRAARSRRTARRPRRAVRLGAAKRMAKRPASGTLRPAIARKVMPFPPKPITAETRSCPGRRSTIGSPSAVVPIGVPHTQAGPPMSMPVSARSLSAIRRAPQSGTAGSPLRAPFASSSPPATTRPSGVPKKPRYGSAPPRPPVRQATAVADSAAARRAPGSRRWNGGACAAAAGTPGRRRRPRARPRSPARRRWKARRR
jgi:hypothetical protein